ncbi:hypothetical protein [Streptomyces sp. ISL-94]|uniref:hypothetical protein n=1 Tax=Streptomyces sp. ISL-94 TaxID=2819190 RepID=UPI001BE8C8BB|nr:hypothetical protein [Streptomyces sp. ISL-94]MBT2478879.1 hypothetical protein [Streptomyces sp. ISL-94]
MQHEGGTADEHGRKPGIPSRTGTGAQPPADAERVDRANERRIRNAHVLGRDVTDRFVSADEEDDLPQ